MNYQLAVVVAIQQAEKNLKELIDVFNHNKYPQVQYIYCYQGSASTIEQFIPTAKNISLYNSAAKALIPEMWRDGVLICEARSVAFLSAHCVPDKEWVDTALSLDMTKYVAVGGSIDQSKGSVLYDWAIYIQRYVNFPSTRKIELTSDIAADNAVYRTDDILKESDLLQLGFWEPSFHRRFIAQNKDIIFQPKLNVIHTNQYTPRAFFYQRYKHGIAFGRERAEQFSLLKRYGMIFLSPAIPIIFMIKLFKATRHNKRLKKKYIQSQLYLIYFITGWALGEMKGYFKGAINDK